MQLLNLVLFWVFFGLLCSHLAKKKGKNPLAWFFAGLTLGIFGVILLYILPSAPQEKSRPPVIAPPKPRSDAWQKMWYYLDPESKKQQGPVEFGDLAKYLRQNILTDRTYIWGEGMGEWKRLSDLPEIVKEMDQA